jgi:hypothetical protein
MPVSRLGQLIRLKLLKKGTPGRRACQAADQAMNLKKGYRLYAKSG